MLKAITITAGAVLITRIAARSSQERELSDRIACNPKEALITCGYLIGVPGICGLFRSLTGLMLPDAGNRELILRLTGYLLSVMLSAGLLVLFCRLYGGKARLTAGRREKLLLFCDALLSGLFLTAFCEAGAPVRGLLQGLGCGAASVLGTAIYCGISEKLRLTPVPFASSNGGKQTAGEIILRVLTACLTALIAACFAGLRIGGV